MLKLDPFLAFIIRSGWGRPGFCLRQAWWI